MIAMRGTDSPRMSRGIALVYASSHPPTARTGQARAPESLGPGPVCGVAPPPLVAEPGLEPEPAPPETLLPQITPPLAHHGRVRRTGVVGEHGGGPAELVAEQTPAHVVDVVGIPVVR